MKKLIVVGLALAFTACDFLPGGGGGTGGGGGPDGFTKGFVYVLKDDKNLYAADERDYSKPFKLTTLGGVKHPSLSRDGKRVVFIRTTAMDSEIATVSVAGGMVSSVLVASTTAVRNLRTPVFTPDGLKVVFAFDDMGTSAIGIVNTDGSGFRTLASRPLAYAGISMYPDGSGVLAAAGNSTSQLTQVEKVSLTNGSGTSIVSSLGSEVDSIASRVVISPDGKKAAFDGRLKSNTSTVRIFVLDLTTKAITQLTDYPGDQGASDSAPCWLGNDKVCFSSDSGGNDQVYALAATGMKTSGGLQVAGASEPWYGPNP